MAFVPPRIFSLTDRRASGGLSHDRQVRHLLCAGLRWVQVRDKETPDRRLLPELDQAVAEGRKVGALIAVNDRPDLALLCGAGGLHLGEADLPLVEARRVLGPAVVIGRSSHDEASARAAEADGADYVAFGPIFPTASKSDAREATGLERLRRVRDALEIPLVAIGGITLERAMAVLEAGADSVAVIQDLVGAPEIGSRAALWQRKLNREPEPRRGLVFLTGFMGSGKTTVGKLLAEKRGCRFVDLDRVIEEQQGRSVAAIFAAEGESAFRAAESTVLRSIPAGADAVVALGGGTLMSPKNQRLVGFLGPLAWLDPGLEASVARCGAAGGRPLLALDRAAELHAARLPGYETAGLCLTNPADDPGECAQTVLDWFEGRSHPPGAGETR